MRGASRSIALGMLLAATGFVLSEARSEEAVKEASAYVRLSPDHEVWIDKANKRVVIGGAVALREGQLELFACLKGTKEHESIVAANTRAYLVHAGLIAVGATPGQPARFKPTYRPATGDTIGVSVYWTDEKGQRRSATAQDWVKNVKTGGKMAEDFVFAGSGYWVDRLTGDRHYMAEDGDFVCVSNFATAMLDLPIESTQSNAALLFEALTEQIPPRGTRVALVLTPKIAGLADKRGADPDLPELKVPAEKPASTENSDD